MGFRTKFTAVTLAAAFVFSGLSASPKPYIRSLRALEGTSYRVMNCYAFVCLAHSRGPICPGSDMLADGCKGKLALVDTFNSLAILTVEDGELKPGDVAVFWKGGHVAAYLGHHTWVDSTPLGVREFRLLDRQYDAALSFWYHGPIHVYRWKS